MCVSGRPKSCTDENTTISVLAAVGNSPHASTKQVALESGISKPSVHKILKENKFRPDKLQIKQQLLLTDRPKRIDFCYQMLGQIHNNPNFVRNIVFTDEATLFMNGSFNRQNYRYWSKVNPNWYEGIRSKCAKKLNIWAGFFGDECVGPFFFDGNITIISHLLMLQQSAYPAIALSAQRQGIPLANVWFQQDGAPAHWSVRVRDSLNGNFPNRWIGRGGAMLWPPQSPDFAPMDFFAWGYMRQQVFTPERPKTYQDFRNQVYNFSRQELLQFPAHLQFLLKCSIMSGNRLQDGFTPAWLRMGATLSALCKLYIFSLFYI